MDFTLGEDLVTVRDLSSEIFADLVDVARAREVERDGGFDARLWRTLAEADLIGLALEEKHGGAGLGLLGLVTVLEQQGRRVAPVPLAQVVAGAAMPLADHGTDALRAAWLPGILDGSVVVVGAFDVAADQSLPLAGTWETGAWRVSGTLVDVPAGPVATAFVLPFATDHGIHVALVPAGRVGVSVEPMQVTNHQSSATVTLDQVEVTPADLLQGDGRHITDQTRSRLRIALSALAFGVCQEAVTITAAYTSQRLQFGRPLSTNQAVALRAADAHLDAERIRLTTLKAAWHHDRGEEEEARAASLVAKWWASTGGLRAVHATQHLHGGIGADVDYPIHRYFLWGRQLAFSLGSAGAIEAELGDLLSGVTPIGAPA